LHGFSIFPRLRKNNKKGQASLAPQGSWRHIFFFAEKIRLLRFQDAQTAYPYTDFAYTFFRLSVPLRYIFVSKLTASFLLITNYLQNGRDVTVTGSS
jgi:hypothetical protein